MGSDMWLDSLSSSERETATQGQETDAAPQRSAVPLPEDAGQWSDALPLLLILFLLLFSPLFYDLLRRLGTR